MGAHEAVLTLAGEETPVEEPAAEPTPAPAASPAAPVCAESVSYSGPEVCKLLSINVKGWTRIMTPFWNLILIGFGLTMTFYGGQFMF